MSLFRITFCIQKIYLIIIINERKSSGCHLSNSYAPVTTNLSVGGWRSEIKLTARFVSWWSLHSKRARAVIEIRLLQIRTGRAEIVASDNRWREGDHFDIAVRGNLQGIVMIEARRAHHVGQSARENIRHLLLQLAGDRIQNAASHSRQNACRRIRIETYAVVESIEISIHQIGQETGIYLSNSRKKIITSFSRRSKSIAVNLPKYLRSSVECSARSHNSPANMRSI